MFICSILLNYGGLKECLAEDAQPQAPSVSAEETREINDLAWKEKLRGMSFEERFNQLLSVDFRNMDIIDALKFLSSKGNLNIITSKNVSGRATLTLESVALKDVFDLMLRSNGLAFVKEGEIFNVMTEAEYRALYGKNFYDVRTVKVFRLKYSIPEQAFSLLDALKSEVGRVLVDQESGNVLLMDTPERIAQMQGALEEFEKQNTLETFTLKYAKAKDAEEILKTRLDLKKVGSIKADERNNQIIVQTLVDRMQEIRSLIADLDKPTREVLIDTKIVKINLSDQIDTGIEWEGLFRVAQKAGKGNAYVGSYPASVMTAGSTTPTFQTRNDYLKSLNGNIGAYPFSGTTSSLNAAAKTALGENMHFGLITEDYDFDFLFNLLKTIGKTKVLSNPKLVVVNNQEAKIHIGERQAYVTTTTSTGQTTSTISEEVQFVDVGIQLSVTPTINEDGFVTMKIRPEISSVSSTLVTPTNNRIPIIDTSLTETTVMMKDGTTLLIGGLRKEEKVNTSAGLPWVSSLPFVGNLFKSASDRTTRTELLVMITPHIISAEHFTLGDDRKLSIEPGKQYQEYTPLSPDKAMFPQASPKGVDIKPYREYLGSQEIETTIKEAKYER